MLGMSVLKWVCVAQWLDLFTATGTECKRDTEKTSFKFKQNTSVWHVIEKFHVVNSEAGDETNESRETEKTTRFISGTQCNF